jgi:hypothetical protein
MTDLWKSFNNNLSANYSDLIFSNRGSTKGLSIVDYINTQDLFPFKIVTYGYLKSIGKISPDRWLLLGGKYYRYAQVRFLKTDKWLPVGDVVSQTDYSTPADNAYDKIPDNLAVLLVYNDPKYCTIAPPSGWQGVTDFYKCTWGPVNQGLYSYDTSHNWIVNNDYRLIQGTVVATQPPGTKYETITSYPPLVAKDPAKPTEWEVSVNDQACDPFRIFAAVKIKYLRKVGPYGDGRWGVGGNKWPKATSCDHDMVSAYSSPFNTITIKSSSSKNNYTNWIASVAAFYDIMPIILKAQCCAGTLPAVVSRDTFCDIYKDPQSLECKDGLNIYCNGSNLLTDECYKYCKTNDCNASLTTFCRSNVVDKTHTNYNKTCSCFLSDSQYDTIRRQPISSLDKATQDLILNKSGTFIPKCDYDLCSNSLSLHPFEGVSPQQCAPNQIQLCLNQSAQQYGSSQGSQITSQQANNCVQQSTVTTASPPSTSTPSTSTPSTSTPSTSTSSSTPASTPSTPPSSAPGKQDDNSTMIILAIIILIIISLVAYFVF